MSKIIKKIHNQANVLLSLINDVLKQNKFTDLCCFSKLKIKNAQSLYLQKKYYAHNEDYIEYGYEFIWPEREDFDGFIHALFNKLKTQNYKEIIKKENIMSITIREKNNHDANLESEDVVIDEMLQPTADMQDADAESVEIK